MLLLPYYFTLFMLCYQMLSDDTCSLLEEPIVYKTHTEDVSVCLSKVVIATSSSSSCRLQALVRA